MEQLLQQILGELKDIKNNQIESNERLTRIEKKLDAVHGQTADLIASTIPGGSRARTPGGCEQIMNKSQK